MRKQINAMFPGTFDPIHKGHLNIIKRCSKMFDKVYVVVSVNIYKKATSACKIRLANTVKEVKKLHLKNVEVLPNMGLTVDFAKKHNVSVIVRGIRDEKDAFYEINMAKTNHALNHKIETILMLPQEDLINMSSTAIKYLNDAKKVK